MIETNIGYLDTRLKNGKNIQTRRNSIIKWYYLYLIIYIGEYFIQDFTKHIKTIS